MNLLDITVQGLYIFLVLQMAKYEVSILVENIQSGFFSHLV